MVALGMGTLDGVRVRLEVGLSADVRSALFAWVHAGLMIGPLSGEWPWHSRSFQLSQCAPTGRWRVETSTYAGTNKKERGTWIVVDLVAW